MKKYFFGIAVVVFVVTGFSAVPVVDDNLCAGNENIIISFKMKNSAKTAALLAAKDGSYIVYRFGTKNNVELEYPQDKKDSFEKFFLDYNWFLSGEGYSLYFRNGGFQYEIYENETYGNTGNPEEGGQLIHSVGIGVKNLSTGKITYLEGMGETVKGRLWDLKDNNKIRKLENSGWN